MRDTRAAVICAHLALALHHSGLTMRTYATTVRDLYEQRTPRHARTLEFHTTRTDPYADERANAQIVQRFIDGTTRMPVEIEEAMALALPQPFRGECQRELAERYGNLAAPIPTVSADAPLADAGKLMAECGQALVEISRSYSNGMIVHGESNTARAALNELTDVIAQATSLRERLTQALSAPAILLKRAS
jgi:hypothetical protein